MLSIVDIKDLVAVATAVLVTGLTLLVTRYPKGIHRTFSQHAAASRRLIVYYSALFGIVLPMLVTFFFAWFIPTYELSVWFGVFIVASSIFQFACTLIPETSGWRVKYHRALAGVSAALLAPALSMLLLPHTVSVSNKMIALFSVLVMVSIIVLSALTRAKPLYSLLLQAAYFTAFFIPILSTSYLN
ncbi:hypothetical protein ACPXCE_09230 [Streptomyces sp. DT24]|uniref:hypothetical protein n=1 Tax=unclassified Streptomyces TaxID=2593676 RepID=UPI003CEF2F34